MEEGAITTAPITPAEVPLIVMEALEEEASPVTVEDVAAQAQAQAHHVIAVESTGA